MSRPRTHRLVLGLSACVLVLASACTGDPAAPSAPREFAAPFDVEAPIELVAGDGQAWILTEDAEGPLVTRIDHTGRSVDVVPVPGQVHHMARYHDGVVVARIACDDDECEETVTRVLVLDRDGSTVAEEELTREPGSPERSDGLVLLGVDGDVVWIDTSEGAIGYDVETGRTRTGRPDVESPEWTSHDHDVDPEPYRVPVDYFGATQEAVTGSSDGEVFVLESAGVVRRFIGLKGMETLDVPVEIFSQRDGPASRFLFDKSSTTIAGCIVQADAWPTSQCYVGSL
jgi:hypothetical protein